MIVRPFKELKNSLIEIMCEVQMCLYLFALTYLNYIDTFSKTSSMIIIYGISIFNITLGLVIVLDIFLIIAKLIYYKIQLRKLKKLKAKTKR